MIKKFILCLALLLPISVYADEECNISKMKYTADNFNDILAARIIYTHKFIRASSPSSEIRWVSETIDESYEHYLQERRIHCEYDGFTKRFKLKKPLTK